MSNTVFDVDFTRALPPILKNNEDILSLAKIIAEELQLNANLSHLNVIYARIDELEEHILDILSYDLHVDFYDSSLDVETKRKLIRNSFKWHIKKGTKAAVEELIVAVFGNGKILEWFEYGGQPHHFKVFLIDAIITKENYEHFHRALSSVKRLSSWLEETLNTVTAKTAQMYLNACQTKSRIRTRLKTIAV